MGRFTPGGTMNDKRLKEAESQRDKEQESPEIQQEQIQPLPMKKIEEILLKNYAIDSSIRGIALGDLDGKIFYVNGAFLKMWGYDSDKELIGRSGTTLWRYQEKAEDILEEIRKSHGYTGEMEGVKKDGSFFHVRVSASMVRDDDGNPATLMVSFEDITEKKLTRQALVRYERELRYRNRIATAFLTTPDNELYKRVLQIILDATRSSQGVFGYIDQEGDYVCPSMTMAWDQCGVADKDIVFHRDAWSGIWGKALVEKKVQCINEKFKVPEGHVAINRALDVPLIYGSKTVGNFLVANKETDYDESDIEMLKGLAAYAAPALHFRVLSEREERQRQKAEEALRFIVEGTASATGEDFFKLLIGNLASALGVRYALIAEFEGPPPDAVARTIAVWAGDDFAENFEYNLAGTPCAEIYTGENQDLGVCFYPEKVRELFPEDEELQHMDAESYIGIAVRDSGGNYLGHIAVLDDRPMKLDYDARSILKIFSARSGAELERNRAEDELKRHRDQLEELVEKRTAELKRANEALVRTQKFETIAQLSMGLSHEIKNPLAIMKTHSEILEMDKKIKSLHDDNINYSIGVLHKQIDRIASTIDTLKTLGRNTPLVHRRIDIGEVVHGLIEMFKPRLDKSGVSASINVSRGTDTFVEADESKLMQVFTNVVFNALESMRDGGSIDVRLEKADDSSLRVSFTDTGHGINEEDARRVFDPFFTTKSDGTGIGLAVSHSIIQEHHGAIAIESSPGSGTTVNIILPLKQEYT